MIALNGFARRRYRQRLNTSDAQHTEFTHTMPSLGNAFNPSYGVRC